MKTDPKAEKFGHFYTIPEGFLSIMHMVSAAYIQHLTNKVVVSGYGYMPLNTEGSFFV